MNENLPLATRAIPDEAVPLDLVVCLARFEPDAGAALAKVFDSTWTSGKSLAQQYAAHLKYNHDLAERDLIWEAGPSTDFTRYMAVFKTGDPDTARQLFQDDPFLKNRVFVDAWWRTWSVHTPYWKVSQPVRGMIEGLMRGMGILPAFAAGVEPPVREVRVNVLTPPRLFVSLARTDTARITKFEEDDKAGRPVPSFLYQHAWNRLGPGGSTQMGYEWEAGPLGDAEYDLTIFSVASLEMAKMLRDNDPFTQNELFYDANDWFEWTIHYPFRKASPGVRAVLADQLQKAGLPVA